MIKARLKKRLNSVQGVMHLDVDFEMKERELLSIFGPSGSGKTSILRMIAGLLKPDEGYLEVGGRVWFDSSRRINLPVQARSIGFVFQDASLFPNMTVAQHLEYALGRPDPSVDAMLEQAGLSGLKDQYPASLSGGQRQRVALLRGLIRRPGLLLLDEPFSALDLAWRNQMQEDLRRMIGEFRTPAIFVSHDLSEVFKLSETVMILSDGRIARAGKPHELFDDFNISGKFKFPGEVVSVKTGAILNVVVIRIGHYLTKVLATDDELKGIKAGDKILVSAKAFNPVILKMDTKEGGLGGE